MKEAQVFILLSTYNGEKYIRQQLDSLCQQTFRDFSVLVRDDGSTDTTVEIIEHYARQYANINLLKGRNIGVVKSFFALLKNSPSNPLQFYAFCDQDDVWKPDKLATAVKALTAAPNPSAALYCTRLAIVDQQLRPLGLSPIPSHFGFENALVENTAIGCTQIFGETIRQIILKADPEVMMMHDWWAYLVATAFGTVIYAAEPSLYYRQHTHNVVGWDKGFTSLLKKSAAFLDNLMLKKNGLESLNQAQHFLNAYPNLPIAKQILLNDLLQLRHTGSLIDRYRFLTQHAVKRNHRLENLILMLAIWAGLIEFMACLTPQAID